MRTSLLLVVVLIALAFIVSASTAETLWDQSNYDLNNSGFPNSESGAPLGTTNYTVNDIVVDNVWQINKITEYFTCTDSYWATQIMEGTLNIFPKHSTSSTPGADDDPTDGTNVPMIGTVVNNPDGDITAVTATVNVLLDPGDYWIAITPVAPYGGFGPELQLRCATQIGKNSVTFDASGESGSWWMPVNPGFDASIIIKAKSPFRTTRLSIIRETVV